MTVLPRLLPRILVIPSGANVKKEGREEREAVSVLSTTLSSQHRKAAQFHHFCAAPGVSHSLRSNGDNAANARNTHSCQERGGFAHARIIGVEHEGIIIILVAQISAICVQRQPGAIASEDHASHNLPGCGKVDSLLTSR